MKDISKLLRILLFTSVGLIFLPFVLGGLNIGGEAFRQVGWVISLAGLFFCAVVLVLLVIVDVIDRRNSNKE